MWQLSLKHFAKAAQLNGFVSPEQHAIKFVQVTAAWIHLALEELWDQAFGSAL